MKVVLSNGLAADGFVGELRGSFPGVNFQVARSHADEEREIVDANVFAGRPDRAVFAAAGDGLRWIHCPGTGVDWLQDVPALVESDVVLTNGRGAHASAMADHVFALLLALAHQIPELVRDQHARRWATEKYNGKMVGIEGRTMGILAMGDIGLAAARRATGFGIKVYGVDVRPMAAPSGVEAVWPLTRLDDMLSMVDLLVVTAPLTPETRGLIDRRRIDLLRPGAFLIVVSRGGIVIETALVDAIRSHRLAGAGFDVTDQEPLPPSSPLWDLERVIITPHVSANTADLLAQRRKIFKENLARYLRGDHFTYVCDKRAGF